MAHWASWQWTAGCYQRPRKNDAEMIQISVLPGMRHFYPEATTNNARETLQSRSCASRRCARQLSRNDRTKTF